MAKKNESSNSNQETLELDPDDVTNPDEEKEEEESQEEKDSDESDPNAEEEDSEDKEESDDEGEYEIVLEGDEGLSDKELKTQKFHARMNERKAETLKAKESEAKANAELDAKDRELQLVKQLLEQKGQGVKSGPPNPDDYDGGSYDPKYIQDINTFHANQAAFDANKRILQARAEDDQKKKVEDKKKQVEKSYESHYQRATDLDKKLKNKDYDATEKAALDILDEAKADFIVEVFDQHSELIFYKLGKDPAKAKYFNELLDRNPGKAIRELAIFESKIKRVKRKKNNTPEPEKNAKGGYIKSKKGERGPPGAKYK